MRYIKDEPFIGHIKGIEKPETTIKVILGLAEAYQPIRGLELSTAEIRKMNRAITVLEGEPNHDGEWYAVEEDDFDVLQRVAVTLLEKSTHARSAPDIEDAFDAALKKPPEREAPPENVSAIGGATGD